ncbi:MAG TPA: NUDIX hydrolase [Candidatus Saccharimonadales bacterium]|nr:NUDIX hydrolase [Candidatus Saccharimonadales bacterium]
MTHKKDNNPWKTLSSRIAYQSPYLTVREDKVITPGGSEGIYSVIESKPGVLIIAQTENDEIYLIESFRYPLQAWRWELPGGGIERGDTPLEAAQKELEEELGLRADKWQQLGDIYPSNNGPFNDHNFVFLARGLHTIPNHHETGEAIRPPRAIPWKEVLNMVGRGELTDGQSLGVLLHYLVWKGEDHRLVSRG